LVNVWQAVGKFREAPELNGIDHLMMYIYDLSLMAET
jgi:hypothetical protein